MVRDFDRSGNNIIATMHLKQGACLPPRRSSPRNISPRRATVSSTAHRNATLDQRAGESSSTGKIADLERAFWAPALSLALPFPQLRGGCRSAAHRRAAPAEIADKLFWQIEDALETHAVVAMGLEDNAINLSTAGQEHPATPGQAHRRDTERLLTECVLDPPTAWIDTLRNANAQRRVAHGRRAISYFVSAAMAYITSLTPFSMCSAGCVHRLKRGAAPSWEWRVTDRIIPD